MATSDIKIGKHTAVWTPSGGSPTTLGFTKEGSVITVKKTNFDVEAHELMAPAKRVYTGCEITASLILLEWSLDTIAMVLQETKTTIAGPKYSVDVNPLVQGAATPGKLVFHPAALGGTTYTEDKTINAAVVDVENEWALKVNADLSFAFKVRAVVSYSGASLLPLLTIGDPATGVVYTV